MTSYIPENPIETNLDQTTSIKFTWKTSLFPEKTRLETCVDILAYMANPGQCNRALCYKTTHYQKLMENSFAIEFLSDLGLIKPSAEESEGNYSVTQRGKAVLKYFKYFDNLNKEQKTRALKHQ